MAVLHAAVSLVGDLGLRLRRADAADAIHGFFGGPVPGDAVWVVPPPQGPPAAAGCAGSGIRTFYEPRSGSGIGPLRAASLRFSRPDAAVDSLNAAGERAYLPGLYLCDSGVSVAVLAVRPRPIIMVYFLA